MLGLLLLLVCCSLGCLLRGSDALLTKPADQQGRVQNVDQNDMRTLDNLMSFLRSPRPWFSSTDFWPAPGKIQDVQDVVVVCGNWYDPHKAPLLAQMLAQHPESELLLTGGVRGRLTSRDAELAGGEPILLHSTLKSHFGADPSKMFVYSGSRVTNHNLRSILNYARQVNEFTQRLVRLHFVEEGFLVRREAASLQKLLRDEEKSASAVISGISFVAVGANNFTELMSVHRGSAAVAMALVVGEHDRLERYATAGRDLTAAFGQISHGQLVASGGLDSLAPSLRLAVADLQFKHGDGLLRSGFAVLENSPREQMLEQAAPVIH